MDPGLGRTGRETMRVGTKIVVVCVLLALVVLFGASVAQRPEKRASDAPYVSGELIVKFTPETGEVVDVALTRESMPAQTGLGWLDALNERYAVTEISRLFPADLDVAAIRRKFPERARDGGSDDLSALRFMTATAEGRAVAAAFPLIRDRALRQALARITEALAPAS